MDFSQACALDISVEQRLDVPEKDDFPLDEFNRPTEDWRDFENMPDFAWNLLGGQQAIRDLVQEISVEVCQTLYREVDEVDIDRSKPLKISFQPNRNSIAWYLERHDEYRIVISTLKQHVDHYNRKDPKSDLKGILTHELTHLFQYHDADGDQISEGFSENEKLIYRAQRGRMLEGMADFVRTQSGWVRHFSTRNDEVDLAPWGEAVLKVDDEGNKEVDFNGPTYQSLGWFFTWLEHLKPGIMYKLNRSLDNHDLRTWSFDAFQAPSMGGDTVQEWWNRYRRWARQPSCESCGEGMFCDTLIPEQCGAVDLGMARCVEKPAFCTMEIDWVCGCDGESYRNACEASRAGVSLMARSDCETFANGLRPPD